MNPRQQRHQDRIFQRITRERDEMRQQCDELAEALECMSLACDEWVAEFTQKKRGMNWGVVNDAYLKTNRALANFRRNSGK